MEEERIEASDFKNNEGVVALKLSLARAEIANMKLKKTGRNNYSDYDYYELGDFLPEATKCLAKHNLCAIFNLGNVAELKVIDELGNYIVFSRQYQLAQMKNAPSLHNIQATSTYMKRYLYIDMLELAETDTLDRISSKELSKPKANAKDYSSGEKELKKISPRTSEIVELAKTTSTDFGKVKLYIQENFKANKIDDLSLGDFAKLKDVMTKGEI